MNPQYHRQWVSPEGAEYRNEVYNRQKVNGTKPLIDNPTIDEIKSVLRVYNPYDVLEVGCGWGRITAELCSEFRITGCDVALDMLDLVPNGIPTFAWDVTQPPTSMLNVRGGWDVVFSRGVLHYLLDDTSLLDKAFAHMASLANKRVILWELPAVCDLIKGDPHFEPRPIIVKAE